MQSQRITKHSASNQSHHPKEYQMLYRTVTISRIRYLACKESPESKSRKGSGKEVFTYISLAAEEYWNKVL